MTDAQFKNIITRYYLNHKRDLPWRKNSNPYRIMVSEIMLQQTQVSRVAVKYREFLKAFPNFHSLATASVTNVLKLWSGLGYNRRALYLKQAAEIVIKKYKGRLPSDPNLLVSLPGIGKNTAGAIMAYAFNKPSVFIETNIRRVYLHHFFPNHDDVEDGELIPIIERTVNKENPREWYWALMDYGTHLAVTIENPNRRSRHYNKQTKFEGSLRQVRGKLLKFILKNPSASITELKNVGGKRTVSVLRKLRQEGFLPATG